MRCWRRKMDGFAPCAEPRASIVRIWAATGGRDRPHNGSTPMAHEPGSKAMGECNGFSPEDELLLLLARGRLGPEVEDRARSLLEHGLPWSDILRRAWEQDVFPLLYRNLRRLGF